MGAIRMTIPNARLNLPNYEEKTTFMQDFAIADIFGAKAVQDTYDRAFDAWKEDVTYLTELVIVLNTRCWLHFEKDRALSQLYGELYHKANAYAYETLEGEELKYYFNTTD